MIEISKGNLLEAPVEALVNTVNTKGIMGTGIALQFKQAFPERGIGSGFDILTFFGRFRPLDALRLSLRTQSRAISFSPNVDRLKGKMARVSGKNATA